MPNVARNVRLEELEAEKKRISLTNIRGTLGIPAPLDKTTEARLKKLNEQIAAHKKAVEDAEQKIEKQEDVPEPEEDRQFTQKLGYELEDTKIMPNSESFSILRVFKFAELIMVKVSSIIVTGRACFTQTVMEFAYQEACSRQSGWYA